MKKLILLLPIIILSCTAKMPEPVIEPEEKVVVDFKTRRYDAFNVPYNIGYMVDAMSNVQDLDSDIALSILISENPTFKIDAIYKNPNGTYDRGLFQINDNTWKDRMKDPGNKFVIYDVMDSNDNIMIAVSHIAWIRNTLKKDNLDSVDNIICAYNAGIGRVWRNDIPTCTKEYLKSTKKTYGELKKTSVIILKR